MWTHFVYRVLCTCAISRSARGNSSDRKTLSEPHQKTQMWQCATADIIISRFLYVSVACSLVRTSFREQTFIPFITESYTIGLIPVYCLIGKNRQVSATRCSQLKKSRPTKQVLTKEFGCAWVTKSSFSVHDDILILWLKPSVARCLPWKKEGRLSVAIWENVLHTAYGVWHDKTACIL